MKKLGYVTCTDTVVGRTSSPLKPDAIFTFDSGASMTLDDAVHYMLVLGGTDSGKTASVAMPLANHLCRRPRWSDLRHQGQYGDDIGKLAAACGRSADIVEYGSGPCANRVNLLRTMTTDGRRRFLEDLSCENFNSNNKQWAEKGAHIVADCVALLDFFAPAIPGLDPTIGLIADMLDNFGETASLWKTFRKSVFSNDNPAHRRFVSRVANNKFHIFHYGDDKIAGIGSSRATWDEQVTWNLQGIRMGLRSFLDAPGVLENFCAQDAPGLDVARDVMDGRLILVRFGLATGPVGAKLTRLITSEVYRTILGYGLEQRGKEFFVLMDEFQELADLSNGRFSDKNFIALARSYGGIFVGLTQSLTSIRCEGD